MSGCTYNAQKNTNSGGTATVTYGFAASSIVQNQTDLSWGCEAGTLPQWEVTNLRPNPANLAAVCDGYATQNYIPNYWNSTFQGDWDAYLQQLGQFFDCWYIDGGGLCNVDYGYTALDVAYVRAGLGLTDEGQAYQQHWINATTGNSGHLDDDSNVEPQLYEWAQAAPSSCPDANGVIAGSPNFAGEWDAWQRCQLSQHYVSDFYYSPVMYPVTDTDQLTDGEWESEDVAVWADGAGLPLGSNGLNFEWAQDSTISDNPPASTTPQAQIAMNILYGENYGNLPHPPYYELQSVDSQTAYCTKSDLADCWYYQQRQPPSQYPHPDCYPNYDPAEDVYLAQVFGSITTLEVYYDDLDEISGHSGLSTAYSDWETNTFGNDFYSQASQNCST